MGVQFVPQHVKDTSTGKRDVTYFDILKVLVVLRNRLCISKCIQMTVPSAQLDVSVPGVTLHGSEDGLQGEKYFTT